MRARTDTITRNAMEAGVMVRQTAAEIEQLLADGQWLSTGQVAVLFGKDPSTVHRWLRQGKIGYQESPGGLRTCDPADVRTLLAETRRVKRGDA